MREDDATYLKSNLLSQLLLYPSLASTEELGMVLLGLAEFFLGGGEVEYCLVGDQGSDRRDGRSISLSLALQSVTEVVAGAALVGIEEGHVEHREGHDEDSLL